jgi:Uncharacterized protein conserved in bacteria (DUF2252)
MSFRADNRAFEDWLRAHCLVVEADLACKHERMAKNPFVFLRATFFRWARQIEAVCPELADAPAVLSVGDAHIENFGTWRDAERRLVWGVNDFDEAAEIPYPYELLRLATSARLAPGRKVSMRDIAAAIFDGYRKGLAKPRPTLLDEQETWMRPLVACSDADRDQFWKEVKRYPDASPEKSAAAGLKRSLPKGAKILRFASRVKGCGSLGRPRYVAIATWLGGRVVREAKALVPSAWYWAHRSAAAQCHFLALAKGRFRAPDPSLDTPPGFVIRPIAADARKVDLNDRRHYKEELFAAMGFDLGAIHAADRRHKAVHDDLRRRSPDWLRKAAKRAAAAVEADFAEWAG